MNTEVEITIQKTHSIQILDALKALIVIALQEGFSKTSFLVRDHIKYVKRIQSADDPELYVIFTAKKLFPNDEAYYEKIEKIHTRYEGKQELTSLFERLYDLYYNISKEKPVRRKISSNEAEEILEELLA
jgi:hypothetical protein